MTTTPFDAAVPSLVPPFLRFYQRCKVARESTLIYCFGRTVYLLSYILWTLLVNNAKPVS